MSVSSILLKQGSISSILTFVFLILSLLFVNLQINILGLETYGLLVLLLSVFGTINMLNVGIGSAMVEYYTKFGEDKSVFWSLYIASFIIVFAVSFIILAVCSIFYQSIFNILGVGSKDLNILAFIGFSLIGISRVLGTIVSAYWVANINYFTLKSFNFFNIYLSIVMILFFHEFKFGLNDCLFYAGLLNIIFIFVLTIIIISSVSMRQLNILSNLKIHLKSFMRSGLEFQGLSIINNSFFPIVNIFINNSFGLSSVSYFDIAIKLLRSGRQIIVAATEPFFGKITQLANQNKRLLIKLLIVRYTKYVGMLSVIYLFSNIVFSKFILNIWMGPDVALKTVMLVNIVAFGMAVNISSSVVYNSFIAQKKYRIYIFYHQLILLILALIPFSLKLDSLLQYSYYYSAAFVSSSIYIMYIFYKKYGY